MDDSGRNLYRIDDVLLRTGTIGVAAVLAAGLSAGMIFLSEAEPAESELLWRFVARHGAWLGLAAVGPLAALRVGWTMRRREWRIRAIWTLLRRHGELSVPDLLANSDFEPADVERAVTLLNTRGLGHYVWDRSAGTLQDARLRAVVHHVEKCEACGGEVSLAVPLGTRTIPACPYCGDAVVVDGLEKQRRETLESLRGEFRAQTDASRVPFSIPIFLLLLFAFWPAGIFYAWWKCAHAS